MKHLKGLCLALVAILAVGLTAAVASAHEFESSVNGNLFPDGNSTQTFKTGSGPAVECGKVDIEEGKATTGTQNSILVGIGYLNCKVKVSIFSFEATVSLAKYKFLASGLAHLENLVLISVPVAGCSIDVPAQNNLEHVAYLNVPTNGVTIDALVSGIDSIGSGGECGTGLSSNGTYTGSTETLVAGGTIKWK